MKMNLPLAALAASLLAAGLPAFAADMHAGHTMSDATVSKAPMSQGVVKKADKAKGMLTIAHGPLENLGMPAMTMGFKVRDAVWLDQLKPGDKIEFRAEELGGALTVTQLTRK